MNDLKILRDAWGTPEPPSPATRDQARTTLMALAVPSISEPVSVRRRRRVPAKLRLAAAAGLALAAAATLVVAGQPGGGSGPSVPVAVADVLERAAVVAEEKAFTAPRDDQWIYIEERFRSSDGSAPQTRRQWHRADGGGMAIMDRGKLEVSMMPTRRKDRRPPPGPFESYKARAALPTDPDALLRWAYVQTEHISGAGSTEDSEVYSILRGIIQGGVLPPDLEAGIFRALKQVPGVTVRTVDVLGHPTLSLAFTDDWLRQETLLDMESYTYRGARSTVARDAVINPLKAGNSTGEVKRGSQVIAERVVTAIVDQPGQQRP